MTQRGSWLRAIWAALISLPFPGLGHIYARRWRLGVVLLVAVTVLGQLVVRVATTLVTPKPAALAGLLGVIAISFIVQLGIVIDAARQVRAGPLPERPRWFRSTWFAALVLIPVLVAVNSLPFGWRSFSIPSGSMIPTFMPGDYVLVRTGADLPVARGDVIVFSTKAGGQPDAMFIKRVVALPGDRVSVDRDGVVLNGARLLRSPGVASTIDSDTPLLPATAALRFTEQLAGHAYPVVQFQQPSLSAAMPEATVPPGTLFVLGDNRDNSMDSRFKMMPPVQDMDVVGIAGTIYWSRDRARILTAVP